MDGTLSNAVSGMEGKELCFNKSNSNYKLLPRNPSARYGPSSDHLLAAAWPRQQLSCRERLCVPHPCTSHLPSSSQPGASTHPAVRPILTYSTSVVSAVNTVLCVRFYTLKTRHRIFVTGLDTTLSCVLALPEFSFIKVFILDIPLVILSHRVVATLSGMRRRILRRAARNKDIKRPTLLEYNAAMQTLKGPWWQ